MSDESERTGNRPRTNPDGDVGFLYIEMCGKGTDRIGGIERGGL